MRILLISDPPAAPGYLPRLRYFCDYLTRQGHDVTWLTEEYRALDFGHSYPIITIPMYSGGIADWALKTAWTLLTDWHNRAFARRALKELASQSFDLVLCSTFSDFPLGAARRIAGFYGLPLICDIRDLDEQVDNSRYQYRHCTWWTMPFRRLYRAVHIRRRNSVLRTADCLTTISPWHTAFLQRFNPAVHTIYNGFDEQQFYPEDIPSGEFTVTYIGSLFDWQKPWLRLVEEELAAIKAQDPAFNARLVLHTPSHDPLPHTALGDAIRRSGIMLVLSGKETHGMLTTKFYEALGCEKPVLCVPSDEGDLAALIRYTNAGIATSDREEIRAFIIEQYRLWCQQSYTRQPTLHRATFSRRHQSEQLMALAAKRFR